ncbi:MAG: hypothetical protein AAF840_11530, partial [Bacteroidota bacterium]
VFLPLLCYLCLVNKHQRKAVLFLKKDEYYNVSLPDVLNSKKEEAKLYQQLFMNILNQDEAEWIPLRTCLVK